VTGGSGSFCEPTGIPFDAAIDAVPDAPGDRDNDGVKDNVDNCPDQPNPDQADEDRDGLGDVCDPCPPSPNNTDSDHDGVGDDCDPNPSTAGDHIALFEGFHHGVPTGWTQTSGVWSAANDSVSTSSGLNGNSTLTHATFGDHETVYAGATLTATNGNAPYEIGVVDNFQPVTDVGIACAAVLTANNDPMPHTSIVEVQEVPTGNSVARMPLTWKVGDILTLVETRVSTSYHCLGYNASNNLSASAGATDNQSGGSSPQVGIGVVNGSGTFYWVLIVTSP
jgi:hypothetical protein